MQGRLLGVWDDFREGLAELDLAQVGLRKQHPLRLHRGDHRATDPRIVVPKLAGP